MYIEGFTVIILCSSNSIIRDAIYLNIVKPNSFKDHLYLGCSNLSPGLLPSLLP